MSQAPNGAARPANQLDISGNACGPAALLSSFRCGNAAWQKAAVALPGEDDRAQLRHWIRYHGLRPSETLKGRTRWTTAGINVEDLELAPVRTEAEGAAIELPRGFDAARVRVTGNVVGEPPYRGSLAHAGWQVKSIKLPKTTAGHDPKIVAPAEVELGAS